MKLTIIALALLFLAACGNDPEPKPPAPPIPPPGQVKVKIGTPAKAGQSYKWAPAAGLDDASLAEPVASPKCTTMYEVTATNDCGIAKSKTVVHVFKKNENGELVEVKCMEEEGTNGRKKESAGLRLDGPGKASKSLQRRRQGRA